MILLRILKRTNEGRIEAKFKGIKFGHTLFIDRNKVMDLKFKAYGATNIAETLSIRHVAVYTILSEEKIND